MKRIKLTQGKFAIVDDDMFEYLNQWKWCAVKNTYGDYFAMRKKDKKTVYMHRQLMSFPQKKDIDHINHNTLDNRVKNMRSCTRSQNLSNMLPKQGTSKYKGVMWDKRIKFWRGHITHNNKTRYFGFFVNEKDAAKAYDKEAKKIFSEFAYTNF